MRQPCVRVAQGTIDEQFRSRQCRARGRRDDRHPRSAGENRRRAWRDGGRQLFAGARGHRPYARRRLSFRLLGYAVGHRSCDDHGGVQLRGLPGHAPGEGGDRRIQPEDRRSDRRQSGKRQYRPVAAARHQSRWKPLLLRRPQHRRHADRLQMGHAEPHLQLPDLGLELQRQGLRHQRRQPVPHRPGPAAAGGGARGLYPVVGLLGPDLHRDHRHRHGPRQYPHLADRRPGRCVGLWQLPVRYARPCGRHLVRPHQPALLRSRLQGHMGLRHHDARDRPHHGAEARAPGLHQQRPVLLLRRLAALRQPVADPRPRRTVLVADDLYARALHQQHVRRREGQPAPDVHAVRRGRDPVPVRRQLQHQCRRQRLYLQPDDRRDVHQRRRPGRAIGQQDLSHRLGRRRQRHDRRQQLYRRGHHRPASGRVLHFRPGAAGQQPGLSEPGEPGAGQHRHVAALQQRHPVPDRERHGRCGQRRAGGQHRKQLPRRRRRQRHGDLHQHHRRQRHAERHRRGRHRQPRWRDGYPSQHREHHGHRR